LPALSVILILAVCSVVVLFVFPFLTILSKLVLVVLSVQIKILHAITPPTGRTTIDFDIDVIVFLKLSWLKELNDTLGVIVQTLSISTRTCELVIYRKLLEFGGRRAVIAFVI
jgi:hypothetical protein